MTPDAELGPPRSGRQIELVPLKPGMWMVIIGVVLATLGPLFGFLVGSMMGSTTDTGDLDPIWFSLFLGMVVGGLGIGLALLGARRLMMGRRGRETTRVSA